MESGSVSGQDSTSLHLSLRPPTLPFLLLLHFPAFLCRLAFSAHSLVSILLKKAAPNLTLNSYSLQASTINCSFCVS